MGRRGGGPGETQYPTGLRMDATGAVSVFDESKSALVRWRADGAPLPERSLMTARGRRQRWTATPQKPDSRAFEPRMFSDERMTEAEVSLRVAFHLLRRRLVSSDVEVAIDGAQVRTGNTVHFPIEAFLADSRCMKAEPTEAWQGSYHLLDAPFCLTVHSRPGQGDVVASLTSGQTLRVESKKGPLVRSRSSQEYPLLREAIGQLMTIDIAAPNDLLAVAVPDSPKFRELITRWRRAPLIQRLGIRLLTVHRDGSVDGLDLSAV